MRIHSPLFIDLAAAALMNAAGRLVAVTGRQKIGRLRARRWTDPWSTH
ncbi:MAG TPA: hypothetical protein VNR68_09725 [Sphingomicrobium sp.]|nr:hypothetical protein [Sphingomicrobium sp.]